MCNGVFVVTFLDTVYNKTVLSFGFCDTRNNQGLGECYQLRPLARLTTFTSISRKYFFPKIRCQAGLVYPKIHTSQVDSKLSCLRKRDSSHVKGFR